MSTPAAHRSFPEAFAHAIEEFTDAKCEYRALLEDRSGALPDKVRAAHERLQRARLELVKCGELMEKMQ